MVATASCAQHAASQPLTQPTRAQVIAPSVQANTDATPQAVETVLAHQVMPVPSEVDGATGPSATPTTPAATPVAPTTTATATETPATPPTGTPTPPATDTANTTTATATTTTTPSGARMFRGQDEDTLLREMGSRPVVRVIERFNSSTLVFHCDLGNGLEIAFKPARRGERNWWVHEIAGYELARALGIEGRVPPATYKRVPVSMFDHFDRDARLIVHNGMVEGTAIFWMPVLHRSRIQTAESHAEWGPWMDPRNPIPAEHRRRALQIADLIVFDYLEANFDRWNSANVPMDEHDDLVYRDNNRAWFNINLRRVTRGGLRNIRRISAGLLAGVERATDDVLRARTFRTRPRILTRKQLQGYETRRRALLQQIERMIRQHGRENVVLE
jgi:hypothetical protein